MNFTEESYAFHFLLRKIIKEFITKNDGYFWSWINCGFINRRLAFECSKIFIYCNLQMSYIIDVGMDVINNNMSSAKYYSKSYFGNYLS
jgi:hypothetical protein